MDRVTYYHAAKIRADCPQIYSRLLGPFLMEFLYSVTTDHFYGRLYFEIWKRVAKQKMNFKDAFDEVKDEAMWPFQWAEVKAELESDNYKTRVAGIDKNLEEGEAYWLIVEAVRKIVPRLKTYYEYAKKKLDIADKMGLIRSSPHTSST